MSEFRLDYDQCRETLETRLAEAAPGRILLWTDDFSSLWRVLRFGP